MVDGVKLKEQYRMAVISCLAVTVVPFLLGFVLYVMTSAPDRADAESVDMIVLVFFGLLALSPLITVPLVHHMGAKSMAALKQPAGGVESNIMIWALTEYALWEISSLLGFVAVALGAPVTFFVACAILTFGGYAYTFPRWSRWVELVQELGLVDDANTLNLA